jgi:radical SAM superfamily enzyme YgiQ (UPF0313 family)
MAIKSVMLIRVTSTVDKDVDHPQFFDPSYPLKYIQAGLEKYQNISTHLMDCWIRPADASQMLKQTAKIRPDLIVISASSFDIDVANRFAALVKKQKDPPIVIGIGQGYHLNRSDGDANKNKYDAILMGEAEQEFLRLFEEIQANSPSSPGWRDVYWAAYIENKRFMVEDPDQLPFPSYTPEELRAYKSIYPIQLSEKVVWGFLIATRGCPHGCEFCSEVMRVSVGKRIRSRSATNVADEMEHLARQGVNICSFQDDSFSTNRSFVRELCSELIARSSKMAWMARVRVDELNYELLALMKKAGCKMLGIGVESGCQRIIEGMNKLLNPKPWLDLCRQVFRWTKQLNIGTNAYYVIGNPGETWSEIEQTINFALELNSDSIQVHFYTPYAGSAAWEKYKNHYKDYDPSKMFHYAAPMLSMAEVSIEELVELRSKFYRRYLFRPVFAFNHLRRYAGFYWHNPDVLGKLLGIRNIL